eukprot:CCRYP_005359-RA/>CCRYP_005359-RA protein AED:0.13 eAED:0.13 QI:0/-1/0/1/-1/1/1/0/375
MDANKPDRPLLGSPCKKLKTSSDDEEVTVFTFSAAHEKFAQLQLLSTHTVYDLVACVCKHTPIGYDGADGPNDHMWRISYKGRKYESLSPSANAKLKDLGLKNNISLELLYDYGDNLHYQITFLGSTKLSAGEDASMFPRNNAPSGVPPSYVKYQPNVEINLDTMFPRLNNFVFSPDGNISAVNLFQPGRKQQFGFIECGTHGIRRMLHLPVKPDSLNDWMYYFEKGATVRPDGGYNWHSVVMLPMIKLTPQLIDKYRRNLQPGFCDTRVISSVSQLDVDLASVFPKIAALAGLRKDKKVPKGWISFQRRGRTSALSICTGPSEPRKSNAPKGTAFDGLSQHHPVDDPMIEIASVVEIRGLHDLFCVVEGLLATL